MSGPSASPPRSSLGCLGAVAIVLLTLVTLIEAALLLRLDPVWLDRIAFWRPQPYAPDLLAITDPAEKARVEAEIEQEIQEREQQPLATVELLPHLTATGQVAAGRGGGIRSSWGASLTVPPGAVSGASELTMTPVLSLPPAMAMRNAGAVVDLRVGEHEHYRFSRPVELTLPFDRQQCADPVAAVWEQDHWSRLPTTINPDGTVTASLPHASVIGVFALAKLIAAAGGGFYVATRAVSFSWLQPLIFARSLAKAAGYAGAETYQTSFFTFFYYTSGTHAVPGDGDYPVSRQREAAQGVPLFIADLADYFEEARYRYRKKGYNLRRHYVFVSKMSSLGNADLGGPIFISSDLVTQALANHTDPAVEMCTTAAHELLHVAQADWFSIAGASRDRWWIEATGAYMGDRIWREAAGGPDIAAGSSNTRPIQRLLTVPMDRASAPHYYAYSSFLNWLDAHHDGAGRKLYEAINSQGNASIGNIKAAVDSACRRGLEETFAEFAQDLYYRDLWRGEMLPELHRGSARVQAETESNNPMVFGQTYRLVNLNMVRRGKTVWYHQEKTTINELPHLTAWPLFFGVEHLPKRRGGKLVIELTPRGAVAPGLWLYLGTDHLGPVLPAPGDPNGLVLQDFTRSMKPWVIADFNTEGGTDRVTLVAVNTSTGRAVPGFDLERWLLLRPEHVDFKRKSKQELQTWLISWDTNELEEETNLFKGYNIYRRLPGQPDAAAELVQELSTRHQLEHTAPDDAEYQFTVTVCDQRGNESAHSLIELDPFQGVWSGEIALKEGSLVQLCQPVIDALYGDEELGAGEQAMKHKLEVLAENLDAIARLGIPVEMQIERYLGDRYFIRVTELLWIEQEPSRVEMKRVGDRTLEMVEPPEDTPTMVLRLTQEDEMREPRFEFPVIIGRAGNETEETWALRWSFKRRRPLPEP